ncbi:MAG: TlpA family protein disulfide reductase [Thiobacillus sp.]|jgi:thiol-disulfide isomerase/thioredoxin|nr:TlpA family protein disulfide reductase [Thiobacillus sp.]
MKRPAGSYAKFLFYIIPLALIALAAGLGTGALRNSPPEAAEPATASLWKLGFPDSNGQQQRLSQWHGQVVVLNFWASWCAPCREEMPDFVALRTEYHTKGVEFIGIAMDNPANVTRFLQQFPVNYPILVGEDGAYSLIRQLGNQNGGLPYTIVIDRRGNIVRNHLGRLTRNMLESDLRRLVNK